MSLDDYLKTLNIDQIYELHERTKNLIKDHQNQQSVAVWEVVSDGFGVGSFVEYENASAALSEETQKNHERLIAHGGKDAPPDAMKRCTASLQLRFVPESDAAEMCEDWPQEE